MSLPCRHRLMLPDGRAKCTVLSLSHVPAFDPEKVCGKCSIRDKPRKQRAGGVKFPRPLSCVNLGPKVRPNCGCTERTCLAGRGTVRPLEHCQTCDGYSLDPADRLLPAAGGQGQEDVRVDRPPD